MASKGNYVVPQAYNLTQVSPPLVLNGVRQILIRNDGQAALAVTFTNPDIPSQTSTLYMPAGSFIELVEKNYPYCTITIDTAGITDASGIIIR